MNMSRKPATSTSPDPVKLKSMSDSEFRSFAERIHALTGIELPEHKRSLVNSRLSKRLRTLGIDNFGDYLVRLDIPGGDAESREMINAMTTNLTSFFRERHHFDDMVQTLAIGPRNHDIKPSRHFGDVGTAQRRRIWSAGCSTGEEPYSIAMALLHAKIAAPGIDLRILATDIDTRALDIARQGIYLADRIETCPQEYRQAYLEPLPDGQNRITQNARNMINFNQLNIHEAWPIKGPFDTIFCRNILIYFNAKARREIVERMVDMLRPCGTLYLGHSESLLGNHPELEQQGRTTFRKRP